MKYRVAITGVGIISPLGNTYSEVADSLRAARSGLRAYPEWGKFGLSSIVAGELKGVEELKAKCGIPKRKLASMPASALYCTLAAKDAIEDAGLSVEDLHSEKTACLVGSGVPCVETIYKEGDLTYSGKANRVSPYSVS